MAVHQSPISDVEVVDLRSFDGAGDADSLISAGSLRRWMAARKTTFSGERALGLVVVLEDRADKRAHEALRLAVESALLPRVLVVLDAVSARSPLKLKIPVVLRGRDPQVGVLVIRDALGSPYGAGVGGTALGVPRLSESRSDEELRDESIRAVVDALREARVFQATWNSISNESWRAVSSVGLFRGVLGGFTRQATADQVGRVAELLEGQQLETNAGSTLYPELVPALAGTEVPEAGYDSVIPPRQSEARQVYEQSHSAASTAVAALDGLLGEKPRSRFPFMWSKWVGSLLRPWQSRMEQAIGAARQFRQARALQDEILNKADFSRGVEVSQVEAARRVGVEVMTQLPEKYDVVSSLRQEVLNAFFDIRQLRAPLLAALDFRKKARATRPRTPSEAQEHLSNQLGALGIERGLETLERAPERYTPGSGSSATLGLLNSNLGESFLARLVETFLLTGSRNGILGKVKFLVGLALVGSMALVALQILARVLEVGWPALQVNWLNERLDPLASLLLTWLYIDLVPYLPLALGVTGVFWIVRTILTGSTGWIGSGIGQVYRRSLEALVAFGVVKVLGLVATELLGRTFWATRVPPLDRCPDLALRGVPGELCRVGSEALDRILWFSPQGQQLGHYALQGLGVASVLILLSLFTLSRGRRRWGEVLQRDGVASLATLPTEEARLGGNPLWASWANIIYNDWHHASFRSHASEIFAISAQTVANWARVSAANLRDVQGWLSKEGTSSSALEQYHRPAFESVLDHVGRGGEYAGFVSGLNLLAADVGLIGSRSMDLHWERMRGPARIQLPEEVARHADESLRSYLASLASTDLLHRDVRESAPASEEDDEHSRAVMQLRQDLRDAWGSESVVATLRSQVFGQGERHGSDRVIQFIAPEEFHLLDTRDTEPPTIRFAPHGAAEELRIENLIATESFTSAGSLRIVPLIESSWDYSDETEPSKRDERESARQLQRWVPRAGIMAEVLAVFGSAISNPRAHYPVPSDDYDIVGQPEVPSVPVEEEAVPDRSEEVALEDSATDVPIATETSTGQSDENLSGEQIQLEASAIEGEGQSEPGNDVSSATSGPEETPRSSGSPSLLRRILGFLFGRASADGELAPESSADESVVQVKPKKKRAGKKTRKKREAAETSEAEALEPEQDTVPPRRKRRTRKGDNPS